MDNFCGANTTHGCEYVYAGKSQGMRDDKLGTDWYAMMVCRFCLRAKRVFYYKNYHA